MPQEQEPSLLDALQDWYERHCDGAWEHRYGVSIGTIDNPGWSFSVDLSGTEAEGAYFEEYRENFEDATAWLVCQKVGTQFVCNGGPRRLGRMIELFLDWADRQGPPSTSPRDEE